jgi:hypothetical protein
MRQPIEQALVGVASEQELEVLAALSRKAE